MSMFLGLSLSWCSRVHEKGVKAEKGRVRPTRRSIQIEWRLGLEIEGGKRADWSHRTLLISDGGRRNRSTERVLRPDWGTSSAEEHLSVENNA